jgi:two-component system cell cycle response regulator
VSTNSNGVATVAETDADGGGGGEERSAATLVSTPSPPTPASEQRGKAVLIVDDSRTIRASIRETLQEQGLFEEYLEAENGWAGLKLALTRPVDLVLCDLEMPGLDGFGFILRFRADPRTKHIPVLMLSGQGSPEKKVEGFARGANDYLVKPCHPAELCARVKNYLKLKLLQDEIAAKNRELSRMNLELAELATTDALTGVHNRRHFMARATEELKRCRRHRHQFGVLLFDADHFKRINDTLGHPQGDKVLVAIAASLRKALRETDLVARYGGEEFVVGLPETPLDHTMMVAERLRAGIEALEIDGMDRPVTVSVGVCAYPASTSDSIAEMIALADEALYRAKAGGRNRVVVASTGPVSDSPGESAVPASDEPK